MYYLDRGGGQFQNLPVGFSLYNRSYPPGQETYVGVLQTAQHVHSNCTFGAWGNDHLVIHGFSGPPMS